MKAKSNGKSTKIDATDTMRIDLTGAGKCLGRGDFKNKQGYWVRNQCIVRYMGRTIGVNYKE